MDSHVSSVAEAYAALKQCGPNTRGGRYLRRFWHPIARVGDLAPGQLRRMDVLGETLTFVCFSADHHALLDDRCPHRGVPLSLGDVVDGSVRCPYHGWRFDSTGACVDAPGERDRRCAAARARSRPLATAYGLVFAWLGDQPPAPFPFDAPPPPSMVPHRLAPIEWPACFLLRVENTTDFSHIQGVHVGSGLAAFLPNDYRLALTPLPDGHQIRLTTEAFPDGMPSSSQLGHPMTYRMPNFFHYRQPLLGTDVWQQHTTWHVPANDNLCRTFTIAWVATLDPASLRRRFPEPSTAGTEVVQLTERILAGELRLADLRKHPNLTEIEDCVVIVAQHRAGGSTPAVFGRADVGVAAVHRGLGRDVVASEQDGWQSPWLPGALHNLLVADTPTP